MPIPIVSTYSKIKSFKMEYLNKLLSRSRCVCFVLWKFLRVLHYQDTVHTEAHTNIMMYLIFTLVYIDTLQNRAIRYFLGVHRFTPILAINGEMGWTLSIHRRWVNMIRLWNRLISMDDNRLTKCVFNSDYTATGKTWCLDMKNLLHQVNMQQSFENKQIVNLEHVKNLFNNKHQQEWNEKLHTVSKLRTM